MKFFGLIFVWKKQILEKEMAFSFTIKKQIFYQPRNIRIPYTRGLIIADMLMLQPEWFAYIVYGYRALYSYVNQIFGWCVLARLLFSSELYRRHIEFGDFFKWNVRSTHCLLSWNYIMWNMHHNRNTISI